MHWNLVLWLKFHSLIVLVQSLLLLKTVIYEMKITTDVFCNVDGGACWCGAPGPKMGPTVGNVSGPYGGTGQRSPRAPS